MHLTSFAKISPGQSLGSRNLEIFSLISVKPVLVCVHGRDFRSRLPNHEEERMKKRIAALLCAVMCVFTLAFAVPATAGTAANVANSWLATTTGVENFNFGNAYGTSATKLPTQVQAALDVGYLETFLMTFLVWGN
jgi:uncharacterized RDD family membrane protein YckC